MLMLKKKYKTVMNKAVSVKSSIKINIISHYDLLFCFLVIKLEGSFNISYLFVSISG